MINMGKFFEELRELSIGIFGNVPYRRKGFLEKIVGENPAIVLDTSAIIDLEAESRRIRDGKKHFLYDLDGGTKLFVPEQVYQECKCHRNVFVNSHVREISDETIKVLGDLYRSSIGIFQRYDAQYGDQLKFAAYSIAKDMEDNSTLDIKSGEISRIDMYVVARALELSSLKNRKDWKGFKPSYVTVLTSDHHVEDMVKQAVRIYGFGGISAFSTKK
jgi:hypothetical protein